MAIICDKPIAHLDTETTGVDPLSCRIIELAIIRRDPDGSERRRVFLVNPGVPIPPDCTKVHGISDADVAGLQGFEEVVGDVIGLLDGCILSGYNVKAYDIPLLDKEIKRVLPQDDPRRECLAGRQVIDTFEIFRRREGMTLSLAYRFYTGKDISGAHGAAADTVSSLEILDAQIDRYGDYPRSATQLAAAMAEKPPHFVDKDGKLVWKDGEVVFAFSKQKGSTLRHVAQNDPGFLRWILKSDFRPDMKSVVRDALVGTFPTKSEKKEA